MILKKMITIQNFFLFVNIVAQLKIINTFKSKTIIIIISTNNYNTNVFNSNF